MNLNLPFKRDRSGLILGLILVVAALIRFYHLRYQSFGLDELHTMNEADPGIHWRDMFNYLRSSDQHPPLFFIIERILFSIFGSGERVARGFTALCSFLGVWAMYLLGRDLLNKRLGLLAAAFACVNYFSIFYAQEARGYSLAFLLSACSYRYFIRLLRDLRKKDMWLYVLFTLGVMYTHYFGMFVTCSQFLIAFILMFAEKDRKRYIRIFLTSGVVIAAGFAVWLPFVRQMQKIQSFWIRPLSESFIYAFFNEYFGNTELLKPILVLVLIFYLVRVFLYNEPKWSETKNNPLLLSFVLFALSVAVIYLIPYIRSVLVVPMLISRYTIVVLPLFLLAFAYGVELIPNSVVRGIVAGCFIFISLLDLFLVKDFYHTTRNTRFRELTMAMVDTTSTAYPILNDRTGWQQDYYVRKFGYKGPMIEGPLAANIDTILKKDAEKDTVPGFWIVNAFYEPGQGTVLDADRQAAIDKVYVLARDVRYFDAHGELFMRPTKVLDTAAFDKKSVIAKDGQRVAVDWGGPLSTGPFRLSKGNYLVTVCAEGQEGGGVWPHVVVSLNDKSLGAFSPEGSFDNTVFLCAVPEDTDSARLTFNLDNDYWDPVTHEDRNAFIRHIAFVKQP